MNAKYAAEKGERVQSSSGVRVARGPQQVVYELMPADPRGRQGVGRSRIGYDRPGIDEEHPELVLPP